MNRVITASAGTGKTWRLTVEYLSLLLKIGRESNFSDPTAFSGILVITFTRKATAEILERILSFLNALVTPRDCEQEEQGKLLRDVLDIRNQQEVEYLRKVLQGMRRHPDQIRVRTIDAFTQTVFRTLVTPFLFVSRFDLDSSATPDIMRETLSRELNDPDGFRVFEALFSRHTDKIRDLQHYETFISRLLEIRTLVERMQPILPEQTSEEFYTRFREEAADFFYDLLEASADEFEKCLKGDVKKDFQGYTEDSVILVHRIHTLFQPGYLRQRADALLPEGLFAKNSKWLKLHPAFIDPYTGICSSLQQGIATEAREQSAFLCLLARRVYQTVDRLRLERRVFDYSDITALTLNLLSGWSDSLTADVAYESLSARIRYLLLDEFQDTSVAQWQLLLPLLREAVSGAGIHPDGGFVLVGDEKQAIYGWRGGERKLLTAVPNAFSGYDLATDRLDTCRRSLPAVMALVNSVFSGAANTYPDWHYEPVQGKRDNPRGWTRVVLDRYTNNSEHTAKDCLRDFVETHFLPNFERMGRPADTAIITRRNADISEIAHHLTRAGISVQLESARPLVEHRSVSPLVSLLRWRAWGRTLDLLAFLRSDWACLGDTEFKRLLSDFRNLDEFAPDFLARWFASLPGLASIFETLRETATITDLLSETLTHFGAEFTTDLDWRNIDAFLRIARGFNDPTGFAAFLEFLANGSSSTPQVSGEDPHGVRLLTVHKAKGLEFASTFVYLLFNNRKGGFTNPLKTDIWCTFDDGFEHLDEALLTVHDTRRSLQAVSPEADPKLCGLRDAHTREELLGELNNLYVALTRARDNLFIFATVEATEKSVESLDTSRVAGLYNLLLPFANFTDGSFTPASDEAAPSSLPPAQADWPVWTARTVESVDDAEREHLRRQHESLATLTGTLVHDYLAKVRRVSPESLSHARDAVVSRYGSLLPIGALDAACSEIADWVQANSETFAEHWQTVLTEYPVSENDQERRIDRLMIDPAQRLIRIVDYKTGSVGESTQSEDYPRIVRSMPGIGDHYTVEFMYLEMEDLGRKVRKLLKPE
jgi:ATP-dependent exoDNAse (exonuclease V) beta subunit